MFFDFCSDREYDREYWTTVWDIEVALQSAILTWQEQLVDREIPALKKLTLRLLVRMPLGSRTTQNIENGWAEHYLTEELPLVMAFLHSHARRPSDFPAPRELLPNDRLAACLKASPEFRMYLAAREKYKNCV